jgi:hypothetical protein
MSSPEPELERQARRHIGPLLGMALVVVFAGLLFLYWLYDEVESSTQPTAEDSADPTLPQGVEEGSPQSLPHNTPPQSQTEGGSQSSTSP